MATRRRERTATGRGARAARLSVLDRLIDEDPRTPEDPPATRADSVRRVKDALRRDLEWLLNTRRTPERAPEACAELRRSLYHYGLPDITSLSADDPASGHRLQREIAECIRLFEPRLEAVDVQLVEEKNPFQQVHFVINAILRMEPDPERIRFDAVLDVARGNIGLAGGHHA